jgi:tetratricopeptide (TPR) repeat protein
LAELTLAAGQPEEAAEHFRTALELIRQTLKAKVKPIQYGIRFFFGREFRDDSYDEPELFCDYIEAQIRLSRVLRELGRPHEAELLLAEAERLSLIESGLYPEIMRLGLALAISRAELSLLLRSCRPVESQQAASGAADAWYFMNKQHPSVRHWRSGIGQTQTDLEWFQATFPDQDIAKPRPPEMENPGKLPCGVFWRHGIAVQQLEAGYYADAIGDFTASLNHRSEGHAFDWLYLAWAHWKIHQPEQARQWFDKAAEWIRQQPTHDVELEELQRQVAQVMSE